MKRKILVLGLVAGGLLIAGAGQAVAASATGTPLLSEGISLELGRRDYVNYCAACHGPDGLAPLDPKGRKPAEFYELIGRLPAINEMMPAFEGTEEQRKALADYLATLPGQAPKGGAQ